MTPFMGGFASAFVVLGVLSMIPTGVPRGALMSTVTTGTNTGNQLTQNYDYSKIFIGENQYETGDLTNGTGSPVTYLAGTVMGRIAASQEFLPLVIAAVDGSQFPVGILAQDITIAAGATKNVPIGIAGRVIEGKLIFNGAETLSSLVDLRSLRDRIASDTVGIVLVVSTDNSGFDND